MGTKALTCTALSLFFIWWLASHTIIKLDVPHGFHVSKAPEGNQYLIAPILAQTNASTRSANETVTHDLEFGTLRLNNVEFAGNKWVAYSKQEDCFLLLIHANNSVNKISSTPHPSCCSFQSTFFVYTPIHHKASRSLSLSLFARRGVTDRYSVFSETATQKIAHITIPQYGSSNLDLFDSQNLCDKELTFLQLLSSWLSIQYYHPALHEVSEKLLKKIEKDKEL